MENPVVQAIFDAFPSSKITAIRPFSEIEQQAEAEALPEVSEEWDPFEED